MTRREIATIAGLVVAAGIAMILNTAQAVACDCGDERGWLAGVGLLLLALIAAVLVPRSHKWLGYGLSLALIVASFWATYLAYSQIRPDYEFNLF